MRRDEKKSSDFRGSKEWGVDFANSGESGLVVEGEDGKRRLHSLSGNERNKLFLNAESDFLDISSLSAMDNPADGRAFAYWDFDRDGWTDVAIINANNPLLNVYRNQIGQMKYSDLTGNIIAVRFVGGNQSAESSQEFSGRDGIGAKVKIELPDGTRLLREYRCGEGFAAQNSATMVIGIGNNAAADKVTVEWPSGKSQTIGDVDEGVLLTAFENISEANEKSGFDSEQYRKSVDYTGLAKTEVPDRLSLADSLGDGSVKVFTTMATWCPSCLKHLPQIADLKSQLASSGVEFFAIPVDPNDTASKLLTYQDEHSPEYQLLDELTQEQRADFEQVFVKHRADALPSTIITDRSGKVLTVLRSVPTISEIRKWMQRIGKSPVSQKMSEN